MLCPWCLFIDQSNSASLLHLNANSVYSNTARWVDFIELNVESWRYSCAPNNYDGNVFTRVFQASGKYTSISDFFMQKMDAYSESISRSPVSRRFFWGPVLICTEKSNFEVYLPEAWFEIGSGSAGFNAPWAKNTTLQLLFLQTLIRAQNKPKRPRESGF